MNNRNEYSQGAAGATAITIKLRGAVMASLLLALSFGAQAHAVFETKTAPTASYLKGVIGVGHGCDGSPTVLVRITVPEGFTSIKPMPKAGWTLETKMVPLAKPYESHGKTIKDRVGEITWKGGKLEAEHYDEFVLQMRTPDKPGKQYFAVRQECEKGVHDWSEIPAAGKSRRDYKSPAAELDITVPGEMKAPHMKIPRKSLIALHVATLLLALVVITLELHILGSTPEQRLTPCSSCAAPPAPPSRITNT